MSYKNKQGAARLGGVSYENKQGAARISRGRVVWRMRRVSFVRTRLFENLSLPLPLLCQALCSLYIFSFDRMCFLSERSGSAGGVDSSDVQRAAGTLV